MKSPILGVFGILCLAVPVRSWDPLGVNQALQDAITKVEDTLIPKAKEAFEATIHDLIDQEVNPLIDKVNAMVLDDANVIKEDVEAFVHNTTEEIVSMIKNAADIAQKFADHELEEIKKNIIDATGQQVAAIEDKFFNGVSDLLDKFYKLVQNVNCMVRGDVDNLLNEVKKVISTGCVIPGLPGSCCWTTGLQWKSMESMGDTQLYDLQVCRRSEGITENTPSTELIKLYVDLQILAKKFFCIDFATGSARLYFTKEYNKWGVKYNSWEHPLGLQSGRASRPVQVLAKWSLGDAPCSTPVDCYEQAIKKLGEARAEIANKADKAELDVKANKSDLDAVQKALETNKADVAQVNSVSQAVDALRQSTSATSSSHAADISDLQSKMSSLSISTDCHDEETGYSDDNNGDLDYADRHDPSCSDGERMTEWRWERNSDHNKIQVVYRCCAESITGNTLVV